MKKFTLIAITMFILSGCSQAWYQRRDMKKLDALSIQQPTEFLRLSNLINPCFDGKAKSDTVVVKGKADTVTLPGSVVISHVKDSVIKTITLPGRQVTLPTFITIHDTIPDTRSIATLNAQLKDCSATQITDQAKLADALTVSKNRLWWIIGLASAIGIFAVVKVYSFVSGGGVADIVKKVV